MANAGDQKQYEARMSDVESRVGVIAPLVGLKRCEVMTVEETIAHAIAKMKSEPELDQKELQDMEDLEVPINAALTFAEEAVVEEANDPTGTPLTVEEIAAINLYTQESALYQILNARLRDERRARIQPFLPYLKLILNGIHKRPALDTTVYRGVKRDLKPVFQEGGKPFYWWSFSSTTQSVKQTQNFLGKAGHRTLFNVRCKTGVNIKKYSAVAREDEILLLPGTLLQVQSVLDAGHDLTIIQLEEVIPPRLLIDFPHPALQQLHQQQKTSGTSVPLSITPSPSPSPFTSHNSAFPTSPTNTDSTDNKSSTTNVAMSVKPPTSDKPSILGESKVDGAGLAFSPTAKLPHHIGALRELLTTNKRNIDKVESLQQFADLYDSYPKWTAADNTSVSADEWKLVLSKVVELLKQQVSAPSSPLSNVLRQDNMRALLAAYACLAREEVVKKYSQELKSVAVVQAAMQVFPYHRGVQRYGCWTLRNLSVDDHLGPNDPRVVLPDATKELIFASQNFSQDAALLGDSMAALWYIVNQSKEGANQFLTMQGLPLIINILKIHSSGTDARLLSTTSALITLLANDTERRTMVAASGAIDAVIGAAKAHLKDEIMQEELCRFFHGLVINHTENKRIVAASGAVQYILGTAMRQHADFAPVQLNAILGLNSLTYEANNIPIVARCDAVPRVVAAMAKHVKNSLLLQDGMCLLNNIARCTDSSVSALVHSLFPVYLLMESMKASTDRTTAQQNGIYLMEALAVNKPAVCAQLKQLGMKAHIDAMKIKYPDLRVQDALNLLI